MAELSGCRRYRPDDMILEGGSITVDGEGTLVVTDQCLLSPGRTCSAVLEEEEDPESIWPKFKKKFEPWSEELRAYMDEHLKDYLGVEKVIWVKEGIDPEETNGHIDDVATFIAPGVMACIWTDDPEYPFYEQCHAAYETLSNAVDAKGRKMKVYKLCMPVNPLFMDQASCDTIDADENAEPRVPDEPLIASYMNYLVTNHGVIVPQYGDENDQLAVDTLQKIYDEVWGRGRLQVRRRPVRAGRLRRRQHPLHYAAGAVRVIVWLPEARHLALQSSGMTLKVYALLFQGNLPHLGNPADQSDSR